MQSTASVESISQPNGRQTSARNAIKHGACAVNTLILPTECHDDYLALESRWLRSYRVTPANREADPLKAELVLAAARAEWFSLRAERNYAETEFQLTTENPDMATWSSQQFQRLARVLRYRTANTNLLSKARKEIEAYLKERNRAIVDTQTFQHREERIANARERLYIFRQKHGLPTPAGEPLSLKQPAASLASTELGS